MLLITLFIIKLLARITIYKSSTHFPIRTPNGGMRPKKG